VKIKQESDSGAALIIVLAFVVLLTGLVVAYFSRTVTDRQVAQGSFNQTKTDQLAMSATDLIITDLKQEIVNGSTSPAPVVQGVALYYPSPTASPNMVPTRSGTPGPGATPIPNLVRRSVRADPIPAPGVISRASAINSTSDVSANGRSVTAARWNKHYFVPRLDPSSTATDTTPVTSFTSPDWVLVTSTGPGVLTAPTTSVIGRYAYAVYDEGGLFDVNAAGYPSSSTTVQSGRKGSVAFADLSALPTSTAVPTPTLPPPQVDNIVGWRNYASAKPAGDFSNNFTFDATSALNYFNYIVSNSDGFLKTSLNIWNGRTDQSFLNRQEFLNFRSSLGFSQNVLQYLGTFSRELNSPSFKPPTPSPTNPDLLTIRVTNDFDRFDTTRSVVGEPLVKTRFPLNRLAWITYKGPSATRTIPPPFPPPPTTDPDYDMWQLVNTYGISPTFLSQGTADNIQSCFGLSFNGSFAYFWTYDHGGTPNGSNATTRILRLDEIADTREPDFFELLQAAILDGSLGQNTGGGVTGGSQVFPDIHMDQKTHHILSIGAAILDQADPDSIPTRVQYKHVGTSWIAYGVESLPYITQMYPIAGRSPNDLTNKTWATYLVFQLWNPHQNMPSTPTVRLRLDGAVGTFRGGNGEIWDSTNNVNIVTNQSVTISSSNLFSVPMPLTASNTIGAGSAPGVFAVLAAPTPSPFPLPAGSIVGFRLAEFPASTPPPSTTGTSHLMIQVGATGKDPNPPHKIISRPFNATMEVDAGGGTWVPYNRFVGIDDATSWVASATLDVRDSLVRTTTVPAFFASTWTQAPPFSLMKADPRATRFGIFQMDSNPTTGSRVSSPLWPSGSSTVPNGYGGAVGTTVEHVPLRFASLPYFPATLCINTSAATSTRTSYADNDGIIRPADAAYPDPTKTGTTGSSTPFYTTPRDYQPIMLNRPFRSVGELGYAFRDLPWKSLDLFTEKSADAGLLDVFSINDETSMVAGRVSLNTQQVVGLKAILSGSIFDELDSANNVATNGTGATTALTMSATIPTESSASPFQNKSEVFTRAGLATTILPLPTTSQDNQTAKPRREVVPRTLSSAVQTRTWNLMIDVIAQSGRYPPGETSLAKFVVEGEQRYWVHVAIDRFTGEVIDRQVEVVKE